MNNGRRLKSTLIPVNYVWRAFALLMVSAPGAYACTTTGTAILCNDAATLLNLNTVNTSANDVTVTITPAGSSTGPTLGLPGSASVRVVGRNAKLINQGLIDPTIGLLALGTSGTILGNTTAGGAVSVNNSGTLYVN